MTDKLALLLRELSNEPGLTQRALASRVRTSLGSVNALLSEAKSAGLLNEDATLTPAGQKYLEPFRVDGAVILAAGFGSRFVPLTYERPKGLLKVNGERMIERQIRQLREVGITDITLVVGYLKEAFEYLIDLYGVKLLYNPDFSTMNNISSVYHAASLFEGRNMYLLSSDNWMRENLFHTYEPGSWYAAVHVSGETREWVLHYNKKEVITGVEVGGRDADVMYGPVYLSRAFSAALLPALKEAYRTPGKEQYYWENVYLDLLAAKKAPPLSVNLQPDGVIYEFENLEELRAFDASYRDHSDSKAMALISEVFQVPESEITGIECLKAGMTNRSFLFRIKGKAYICRIPGEGTEKLIDRRAEGESYRAIAPLGLAEELIYFNPENGYKISVYYEDARSADPESEADLRACMEVLKKLHRAPCRVSQRFDLGERIAFYESLCLEKGEIPFLDYAEVREKMNCLLSWIHGLQRPETLSHIDPVYANFLFTGEGIRLIDWEYAGMADPLIDFAMATIYAEKDFVYAKRLLDYYGDTDVPRERAEQLVIAYMALGGFLWALWAVYKEALGVSFGTYPLTQYRYAKEGYSYLAKTVKEL
jgi:cholinephosphate cytidylyltransferase/choline kinase